MKQKSNLTTAEFARLCGTTKDTLFLYDRRDILKPDHVGGNGYRYYSPYQVFDYDVIHMLKQTGSSLREIQACRAGQDAVFFRALFEQKIADCDEQLRQLVASRQQAERLLALLEYATSRPIGVPELLTLPEQPLLTTPFAQGDSWDNGPPQSFLEHLARCDDEPAVYRQPVGTIYPAEGWRDGIPGEIAFFAAAPRWLESDYIWLKPAGQYVSVLFQGWQTAHDVLGRTLDFIQSQGLRLGRHAYEYDLVDYLSPEPGHSIVEMQFEVASQT